MRLFVCLLVGSGLLLSDTQIQELTLDKIESKKVVEMTEKEFQNYMAIQNKLKQKIESKKEENAQKKKTEYKMVETTYYPESNKLVSNETKVVETTKKQDSLPLNQSAKLDNKVASIQTVEVLKEKSIAEKLDSLDLENMISFLLAKTSELSVFEFEQSKNIIVKKILSDSRFDKDVLNSMNVMVLNKLEFFDFLREVKNAIKQR
jgi:hypothetical protein